MKTRTRESNDNCKRARKKVARLHALQKMHHFKHRTQMPNSSEVTTTGRDPVGHNNPSNEIDLADKEAIIMKAKPGPCVRSPHLN